MEGDSGGGGGGDCVQHLIHRLMMMRLPAKTQSTPQDTFVGTMADTDNNNNNNNKNDTCRVPTSTKSRSSQRAAVDDKPYMLLMQHSQSLELRKQQCQQQQQQPSNGGSHAQNTATTRTAIADTSTDTAVYRRAGLRTPGETAATDWHGGAAWMERIATAVVMDKQAQPETQSAAPAATTTTKALIWLQMLPHFDNNNPWLPVLQQKYGADRVRIVKYGGGKPSWLEEGTAVEQSLDNNPKATDNMVSDLPSTTTTGTAPSPETSKPKRNNHHRRRLEDFVTEIQAECASLVASQPPTTGSATALQKENDVGFAILVESLTPLLVRFGLSGTMQFLDQLQKHNTVGGCCRLIVASVRTEQLLPRDHAMLERMAHAIVRLVGGNVEILRQGVRERGNLVRETYPYTLEFQTNEDRASAPAGDFRDGSSSIRHRHIRPWIAPTTFVDHNNNTEESRNDHGPRNAAPSLPSVGTTVRRDKAATLAIDEGSRPQSTSTTSVEQQKVPQIYMQDDDPEFDDYDEEDPDDDLDL